MPGWLYVVFLGKIWTNNFVEKHRKNYESFPPHVIVNKIYISDMSILSALSILYVQLYILVSKPVSLKWHFGLNVYHAIFGQCLHDEIGPRILIQTNEMQVFGA